MDTPTPVLLDTYSTSPARSGQAHVMSATVDKKSGHRNEYDLTYCWQGERFCVVGCGCLGFLSARACRHAIALFDVLNLPVVCGYMTGPDEAALIAATKSRPCGVCSSFAYSVTLYIQHRGYLIIEACPECSRTVIL